MLNTKMNSSKFKIVIFAVSAIITILIFGIWSQTRSGKSSIEQKLEQVVNARDLYNNSLKLRKTPYLLINFWATWCPPCIEETPSLIQFTKENSSDFDLIMIAQDTEKNDILNFIKTFNILQTEKVNIVFDLGHVLSNLFSVQKLPETFIYSEKSHQIIQISGSIDWKNPEIKSQIMNQFKTAQDR